MGCLDVSNLRILFLEKAFKIYLGFIKVSQPITGGLGWATAEGGLREWRGLILLPFSFPSILNGQVSFEKKNKNKTTTKQQQKNNKTNQELENHPFSLVLYFT